MNRRAAALIVVMGGPGDTTAPTVTITSTAQYLIGAAFTCTFTFSEDVTGFVLGDITVGNGTAGTFATVSASVYTAIITPTALGTVTVDVAAEVAQDAAGNLNTAATQFSIVYITGAKFWYDFSDLTTLYQDSAGTTPVTATGQPIGMAQDKTASAYHVIQATDGARPTYTANQANGLGVARFASASSQFLSRAAASTTTSSQPNTVLAVCKFTAGATTMYCLAGVGALNEALYYIGNSRPTAFAGANLTHATAYLTSYKVYSMLFKGATSYIRRDGVQTNGNAGTQNYDGIALGVSAALNANYLEGDICELIFFNSEIAVETVAIIEGALTAKWTPNP